MALEIERPDQPHGLISDRDLYLQADQWTIAESGDTKAAYGLIRKGGMIPAADVARLHLSEEGGKVVQASRKEASKASRGAGADGILGTEDDVEEAEAEEPKAQWVGVKAPLPPPPPPETEPGSSATPQTPPQLPGEPTVEEAVRLRDRAERMSSGDVTTPKPVHGKPLPKADTGATAKRAGSKTARGTAAADEDEAAARTTARKSATKRGKGK